MSYKIKEISKKKFQIEFQFERNKAVVSVKAIGDSHIYLTSETDGYHWFEFFLSQDPGSDELWERDNWRETTEKVRRLWKSHKFNFTPEDKESQFLSYGNDRAFNENLIKELADIIEPRFAQREKFFEDL